MLLNLLLIYLKLLMKDLIQHIIYVDAKKLYLRWEFMVNH